MTDPYRSYAFTRLSRRMPAIFAAALVVVSSLSGLSPARAAPCSLVPLLREVTINQGLGSYPKLVQGKETLVRAYLSLPSCASSTQTIELRGGTLTVSGGGLTNSISQPFPIQSTPYPLITPYYRTTPPVDSPGDPKFVVPGSFLDPQGTGAFTATFTLSIEYKASTASQPSTVRFTAVSGSKTTITKPVEQQTNPLRVLVVPVGNAAAGYASQYTDVANEELQLAMQTLSRAFPVPDGTGELNATSGGIRYTVLPTLLDVGHLMPNGTFCLNGSAFDDPIKPQLATFAQEWEAANPGIQIDVAVAVIPAGISLEGTCAQGYGVTNSAYAASGGLAVVRLTPGKSGGIMAMEIAHALGMVPSGRGRAGDPSHSPNTAADAGSNRGYNLRDRSFLPDDRTALYFSGTGFTNTSTLLEQLDYQFLLCALGGSTTTDCSNAGAVGDNLPAGPRFVMSGTVDAHGDSASLVVAYSADVPATPPGASGPFTLVQLAAGGGVLRQDFVPVSFGGTHHEGETAHEVGVVDVAVPFDSDAASIEFRNGSTVLETFAASQIPELTSLQVIPAGETNYTDSTRDDFSPTVSPDGGWVAWSESPPEASARIHVAPVEDSSAFHELSDPALEDEGQRDPAWRPDGGALALVSGGDLYVVEVDTSAEDPFGELTLVYDFDFSGLFVNHPTWSPDGTQIAFDADGAIFVIDAVAGATDTEEQLTFTGDASNPSWSQTDGDDRIAYQREQAVSDGPILLSYVTPAADTVTRASHGGNHMVVNTADDVDDAVCDAGHCSLREAINAANATPNVSALPDQVDFDLADAPFLIQPTTELPAITDAVIIDGTTQPGFETSPIVQVDGTLIDDAGLSVTGFELQADGTTVRGLSITGFAAEPDGTASQGIEVSSNGNTIAGNYIGLDPSGNAAGNGQYGVVITGHDNLVGGSTAAERNVISGNEAFGVAIFGTATGASGNEIQGNYIGTDPSGTLGRGNAGTGVYIAAGIANLVGADPDGGPGTGNLISANGGDGVLITMAFTGEPASDNVVERNLIGTDVTGGLALGNGGAGVAIVDASSNRIGGSLAGEGNLISGNTRAGIEIAGSGATGNAVEGNNVGTNLAGTLSLANGTHGVQIVDATNNVVGGSAALAGNLISGNDGAGISIQNAPAPPVDDPVGNEILGNLIGTNAAGDQGIGNGSNGVEMIFSPQTQVGDATEEGRNIISANEESGISIQGSTSSGTRIEGNRVGTDATGTQDLGNAQFGIDVRGPDATIGGPGEGEGNLLSGNGAGIGFAGPDANGGVVAGNLIGTDAGGTQPIPNPFRGILFDGGAHDNLIGGEPGSGAENVIAFNGDGVTVSQTSARNAIRANSIHSNSALGIDLWEAGPSVNGVSANDAGDQDTGANELQNFPVIDAATTDGVEVSVQGQLHSTPNTEFSIQLFTSASCDPTGHGEGEHWLGSVIYTTDPSGSVTWDGPFTDETVNVGDRVTATATDPNGNTSEFSACFTVEGADPPSWTVNNTDDTTDAAGCTNAHCSLREAIDRANAQPNGGGPDAISFAIPGSGPHTISPTSALPTITEAVVVDATTQAGWSAGTPQVVLDGSAAGESADGISIDDPGIDGGVVVRGFVIVDFDGHGVAMGGDFGTLENNFIGLDPEAPDDVEHGNGGSGVHIATTGRNTIGGSGAVGNIIAHNANDGVTIADGAFNGIRGNAIHDNGGLGIDLGDDGVTENDALDEDSGANDFMNVPRILSAEFDGAETVVTGDLDSEDNLADPTIDVYSNSGCDQTGSGEGELYLGSTTIVGGLDGAGHGEWSLTLDGDLTTTILTATASDIQSNTSEFSACFAAADEPSFTVNTTDDADDGECTVSHCSLREAINRANGEPNERPDPETEIPDYIGFNIPGASPHTIIVGSPLPPVTEAATIDGTSQPGWASGAPVIEIDGSSVLTAGAHGLEITASAMLVQGLVIHSFSGNGIYLHDNELVTVQRNFVGTDVTGMVVGGNGGDGVAIENSSLNSIGGFDPAEANVISGNDGHGVSITPGSDGTSDENGIVGNLIGTTVDATDELGNGRHGVSVAAGTEGTRVWENVIAGNGGDGMRTSGSGDRIAGNYIGTNPDGAEGLGNGGNGVTLQDAVAVGVGATDVGVDRNVIAGNGGEGIAVGGGSENYIVANLIGVAETDTGIGVLGNGENGVAVSDAADTEIGSGADRDRNFIAGNTGAGIKLTNGATNTSIRGNSIGTDPDDFASIGNGGDGIVVGLDVLGVAIGGDPADEGNQIAFNAGDGVGVDPSASEVSILGNVIAENIGLGIDLDADGVTANDLTDDDGGANGRQNYPFITVDEESGDIDGTLRSTPETTFTVELFVSPECDAGGFGEGQSFLDSVEVTTNQYGYGFFDSGVEILGEGEVVTATATDPDGSTSEFSRCALPTVMGSEVWTLDPTSPGSEDQLVVDAAAPSWGANGTIAFVRDGNIHTIGSDGTGGEQLTESGSDSSPSLGPVVAFSRFVEDIDLGDQFDAFLLSEQLGIVVTATDDNPEDVRLDLIYTCPGSPNYDVAVGLAPDSVDEATASWTANYDPSIACPNGTISAVLTDFWNRTSGGGPTTQITSHPKPPVAAIYVPEVDDTLLQWNALALHGSGKDADDGELLGTSLRWFVGPPGAATEVDYDSCSALRDHCDIQPPGGAWPLGDLAVMLEVTDSAGAIHTDQLTIQVVEDADEDGIPATVETTCNLSDTNPQDAFGDTDGDAYLAQNDYALGGSPCVAAPSYPADVVFNPDTLYIPSAGEAVTMRVQLPLRDLKTVSRSSVRLQFISGEEVALNSVGWTVDNKGVGTARFDRQDVINLLEDLELINNTVYYTIVGSSSQGWTFAGSDAAVTMPMNP